MLPENVLLLDILGNKTSSFLVLQLNILSVFELILMQQQGRVAQFAWRSCCKIKLTETMCHLKAAPPVTGGEWNQVTVDIAKSIMFVVLVITQEREEG